MIRFLFVGQHDKLLERLRNRPKDFRWEQLKTLLRGFGYEEERGSGSRRKFYNPNTGVSIAYTNRTPETN